MTDRPAYYCPDCRKELTLTPLEPERLRRVKGTCGCGRWWEFGADGSIRKAGCEEQSQAPVKT
jgi:hypothetical protein